jgi:hypothetical protein
MKKNVGTLDALVRISVGFFALAWGIAQMARSGQRTMPLFLSLLGAVKIAEGITRFCPMLALLNLSTRTQPQRQDEAGYPRKTYAQSVYVE